jgi:hypothetical protein
MLVRASGAAAALALVFGVAWGCGSGVSEFSAGGGTPGSGGSGQGGQGTGASANGGSAQGGSTANTMTGTGGAGGTAGTASGGGSATGGAGPGAGGASAGGSGPGSGGSGGSPMLCPSFGDMCTNCLSTSCSQTYCDCHNSPDCVQLALCFNGCTPNDQNCYQSCDTAHANGISPFYLVENCGAAACPSQCAGAVALTACEVCSFTSCSAETDACLADAGCHAIENCISSCTTDTCRQACFNGHSQGSVNKGNALVQCALTSCPNTCP